MKAGYGGEGITITPLSKNGGGRGDGLIPIDGGGDIFNISRRNMHVVDGVENLPKNSRKSPAALSEVSEMDTTIYYIPPRRYVLLAVPLLSLPP